MGNNNCIDISVVIPIYNAENTISICFESVYSDLTDSGYTFEIIMVNDGSTDSSLIILNEIKKYNNLVYIISQKNTGVSSARNAGLKVAKGKYIAFCDSDDMWLKGKTALSMRILTMHPDIKCLGGKYIGKKREECFNGQDVITDIEYISLRKQLFKNHFSPQTVILSCDIIISGILFNEDMNYCEDFEFFNRIVHKYTTAIINNVFTRPVIDKYTYGESGLSSHLWKMEKGELYAICRAYKLFDVNILFIIVAGIFSIVKYFRRLVITIFRKLFV